jgi:hypothetical protein
MGQGVYRNKCLGPTNDVGPRAPFFVDKQRPYMALGNCCTSLRGQTGHSLPLPQGKSFTVSATDLQSHPPFAFSSTVFVSPSLPLSFGIVEKSSNDGTAVSICGTKSWSTTFPLGATHEIAVKRTLKSNPERTREAIVDRWRDVDINRSLPGCLVPRFAAAA